MSSYKGGHVNKDWNTFKGCPNASKMWVNEQSIHQPIFENKEGTFPRVWCQHDGGWCQVSTEPDNCGVRGDYDE
jgi:hypothetical protein